MNLVLPKIRFLYYAHLDLDGISHNKDAKVWDCFISCISGVNMADPSFVKLVVEEVIKDIQENKI